MATPPKSSDHQAVSRGHVLLLSLLTPTHRSTTQVNYRCLQPRLLWLLAVLGTPQVLACQEGPTLPILLLASKIKLK